MVTHIRRGSVSTALLWSHQELHVYSAKHSLWPKTMIPNSGCIVAASALVARLKATHNP